MLRTDFENRIYTAEVLRILKLPATPAESIEPLLVGRWNNAEVPQGTGASVMLYHGFVSSRLPYHRATRKRTNSEGAQEEIPRTKEVRGHDHYLYDVLIAQRHDHIVIAVPFFALAKSLFVKIDARLAGKRIMYEKLNITRIIVHLAAQQKGKEQSDRMIGVTRCQLTYDDPENRRRAIQQVRLTGEDLGSTEIYQQLIAPVLDPPDSDLRVTPVVLGFASLVAGVKKSSAVTDRHGNFKVHIGPGLRQLLGIFELLDNIEAIKDVASRTPNVPILQAGAIEDEKA
jgi:hypothetical protein